MEVEAHRALRGAGRCHERAALPPLPVSTQDSVHVKTLHQPKWAAFVRKQSNPRVQE